MAVTPADPTAKIRRAWVAVEKNSQGELLLPHISSITTMGAKVG